MGVFGWIQRVVLILLILVVVIESVLLVVRGRTLAEEKKRSEDLYQQIEQIERSIELTETLRKYTGEVAKETADLDRSIDNAAGVEDPLSPDVVGVLERLRNTAPGHPGPTR